MLSLDVIPNTPLPDLGWDVLYEANELPQNATPAWSKTQSTPSPSEVISDGTLVLTISSGRNISYASGSIGFSASTGYTVEARIKPVTFGSLEDDYLGESYNCFFDFGDANQYGAVLLYPDHVSLMFDQTIDKYYFTTTDDFHIYHVTVEGSTAKLYVDSVLRITVTGAVNDGPWQVVKFAHLNPGTGAEEQIWDYVYYSTGGAFVP